MFAPFHKIGFIMISAAISALGVAACASVKAKTAQDAVLIGPMTDKVRQELTSAIETALGRKNVTIARTALQNTPRLTIARAALTGPQGIAIDGFRTDWPDIFVLKMSGQNCYLYHMGQPAQTGNRADQDAVYHIPSAQCQIFD